MILADPTGSILYEWVKTGKLVESGKLGGGRNWGGFCSRNADSRS